MTWTKEKIASLIMLAILSTGLVVLLVARASSWEAIRRNYLDDGSLLVLNRVQVDSKLRISHGTELAKILGDLIPSNGVHLLQFHLDRRTLESFGWGGKTWLLAELRLSGPKAGKNPLVKPLFFRQFRVVIRGDSGLEYVQELWGNQFRSYPDGYYGYILSSRFPRQSRWLGFRIEKRKNQNKGGPWERVADLKIRNPTMASIQPWVAESTPIVKSVSGLDLILQKVTVESIPYMTNDIWNHVVTAPLEVRSNGIVLTNWSAEYVRAEDASGNWDLLASHRSLDPSCVWKLEADFEPQSNFAPENLATVTLPAGPSTTKTNILNVPVTISWDGDWIDARVPTNQPNLALKFVRVMDDKGATVEDAAGSWDQFSFRKGDFMVRNGNVLTSNFKPTKVVIAVVANVRATFYTQPRLVTEPGVSPSEHQTLPQ